MVKYSLKYMFETLGFKPFFYCDSIMVEYYKLMYLMKKNYPSFHSFWEIVWTSV